MSRIICGRVQGYGFGGGTELNVPASMDENEFAKLKENWNTDINEQETHMGDHHDSQLVSMPEHALTMPSKLSFPCNRLQGCKGVTGAEPQYRAPGAFPGTHSATVGNS